MPGCFRPEEPERRYKPTTVVGIKTDKDSGEKTGIFLRVERNRVVDRNGKIMGEEIAIIKNGPAVCDSWLLGNSLRRAIMEMCQGTRDGITVVECSRFMQDGIFIPATMFAAAMRDLEVI